MIGSLFLILGCVDEYKGETDEPPPTPPLFVGPEGGTFSFGEASMVIPEGALTEELEIRFYETNDQPPGEYEALSTVWTAEPHGLVFEIPIVVRIPYGPADAEKPTMYWSNDDGDYDRLQTFTVEAGGVAYANVEHFSTAFVAQVATELVEEPEPYPPADVLFIVDNSCSMLEEQQDIATAMDEVFPTILSTGIDFHLGVVSTDMEDVANHTGKLRVANGVSFIDSNTPDPAATFSTMATMGTSGWYEEMGRAAAYTMVELKPDIPRNAGFIREDATLSFVFVSDENDYSTADPVSGPEFRDWLDTKKGRPEDIVAHGFFHQPGTNCPNASDPGQLYQGYVDHTGGVSASICAADWVPDLEAMFDQLLDTGRVVLPTAAEEVTSVILSGPTGDRTLTPAEYSFTVGGDTVYFDQGVRPAADETAMVEYLPQ